MNFAQHPSQWSWSQSSLGREYFIGRNTPPRAGVYTPSKILSWDLDNRLGRKLVYGGDGDLVAELAKGSR